MAKEGTFYFTHDYNARNDPKIKKMMSKLGIISYGIYWSIVEDLYNNANALPLDYESIAFDLRVDSETIKSIITGFDLFVIDGELFGSLSVQKRLDERNKKSANARESALKRWTNNANALPPQCEPNAIKESKEKEIKVKEKREKNDADLHPLPKVPTVYEVCVSEWKQLHPDFIFNAVSGKKIKSIISKIEILLKSQGKEVTSETVIESWVTICRKMPEYYKDKDLSILDSKFNELIAEIKNPKKSTNNGKSIDRITKHIETTQQVIDRLTGQVPVD